MGDSVTIDVIDVIIVVGAGADCVVAGTVVVDGAAVVTDVVGGKVVVDGDGAVVVGASVVVSEAVVGFAVGLVVTAVLESVAVRS